MQVHAIGAPLKFIPCMSQSSRDERKHTMSQSPILSANVRSPLKYEWLSVPRFLALPPAPLLPDPFRLENRSRSRSRSRSLSLSRPRSRSLSLSFSLSLSLPQSFSRCRSRSRSCGERGLVLASSSISIFAFPFRRVSAGGMRGEREDSCFICGCV